jgi:hypothetical protein
MEENMQLLAKEGIQILTEEEVSQVTGGVTVGDILRGDVPWGREDAPRPVDSDSTIN